MTGPASSDAMGEVSGLYFALLEAWNRQDAAGMAALFAAEGVQIGFDGTQVVGPERIQAHLEPIFRDHPTARFVAKVRDCRPLGSDMALLTAVAGMVPRTGGLVNPQANVVQTVVASCKDGSWAVELFQNTPAAFHGRDEDRDRLTAELQAVADRPDG